MSDDDETPYPVNVALGFALRTLDPESGARFMDEWNRHLAPVPGDDREALVDILSRKLMYTNMSGDRNRAYADAILAAGFSRSPAVQVDAATVLKDAAYAYTRGIATASEVREYLLQRAAAFSAQKEAADNG